ncbi:hypothetical protein QVD17_01592 [Tagetes erecta]|uniref:Uncharacterized protein n=1 Tax=Tagetes erecta TaxID=13708 RepID=A0AAD8LCE5_TARER|nr:hypothetical protein QVD17_01592 [Tagetes erecta]
MLAYKERRSIMKIVADLNSIGISIDLWTQNPMAFETKKVRKQIESLLLPVNPSCFMWSAYMWPTQTSPTVDKTTQNQSVKHRRRLSASGEGRSQCAVLAPLFAPFDLLPSQIFNVH